MRTRSTWANNGERNGANEKLANTIGIGTADATKQHLCGFVRRKKVRFACTASGHKNKKA
jgi:hypothetical protein